MRTFIIFFLYLAAFSFIWMGSQTAPQIGWPRTDVELTGCIVLVFGMIFKSAGHWILLGLSKRRYH